MKITVIYRDSEEDDYPEYAGYPTIDRPKHIGGMTVALYDMWSEPHETYEGHYKSISVRSGECKRVYSETADFEGTFTYLEAPRKILHTVDCSESSLIPSDFIVEQWGPDNPDRFERAPISKLDPDTYREDGNLWPDGYKNFHNIIVEFKKTEDRRESDKWKVSIDNVEDEICQFKEKEDPEEDETTPLPKQLYENKKMPGGKYYVSVRETGTKSVGHYFGENPEAEYAVDWLEGIFYSPFDTSDVGEEGNFKITSEPYYEADEVSGKVGGDVKIYLAPRRYAHYARGRYGSWVDPEEWVETIIPSSWTYNCDDYDYDSLSSILYNLPTTAIVGDMFAPYRHPAPVSFPPHDRTNNNCPYLRSNYCSTYWTTTSTTKGICLGLIHKPTIFSEYWETPPNTITCDEDYVQYTITKDASCTGKYYQRIAGDLTGLILQGWNCDGSIIAGDQFSREYGESPCRYGDHISVLATYTLSARKRQIHHKVGVWWNRLPFDTTQTTAVFIHPDDAYIDEDEVDIVPYFYDWENTTTPTLKVVQADLISETQDDAKTHAEATGMPEEDIENIFSGFHSMSTYSSNGDKVTVAGNINRIKTETALTDSSGIFWENLGADYVSPGTYYGQNIYHHPFRNMLNAVVFTAWQSILKTENFDNDDYFKTEIAVDRVLNGETFQNHHPVGLGISPDMEGTLVGIITEGKGPSKVLYVWRKQDEEFDIQTLSIRGDYEGHKTSFESHNGSGNTLHCTWNNYPYDYYSYSEATRNILPTREKTFSCTRWYNRPARATSPQGRNSIELPILDLEFVDQFWHSATTGRLVTHIGAKPDPDNSLYKTMNWAFTDSSLYNYHLYPNVAYLRYEWDDGVMGGYDRYSLDADPPVSVGSETDYLGNTHVWYKGWSPYPGEDDSRYDEGEDIEEQECGDLAKGIHTVVRDSTSAKVELPAPILFAVRGSINHKYS